MKERPILFSAPMVRAILEGRKTQTRRVIKPQPESHLDPDVLKGAWDAGFIDVKCPYGKPSDRLWVRETFWQYGRYVYTGVLTKKGKLETAFEAIGKQVIFEPPQQKPASRFDIGYHKRPSIFLERWAGRITLEITGVRVERLQDISDADALAEGVDQTNTSIRGYAAERFKRLWSSINGADSWHSNPWVWVIEFKKVEAENDQ